MRNRSLITSADLAASLATIPTTFVARDSRWPDPTRTTMFDALNTLLYIIEPEIDDSFDEDALMVP